MAISGVVREWDDEEGLGVIDSAETAGGCWVHFSCIVAEGRRSLTPGDQVSFTYEAMAQDGYRYRAIAVWPPGVPAGTPAPAGHHHHGPSLAYQSRLTIRWAAGTVTDGIPGRDQDGKR